MKLKFFGYLIFIIACILFSLSVHFPGKTAAEYIENRVSQLNPVVKLQIDPIVLSVPLGIKTEVVQVGYGGVPIMNMENFRSFFDLTTFFASAVKIDFKTDVLDGILSGRVGMSRGTPRDFTIETKVETLKLNQIHLGKVLSDCQVSALVNANVTAAFKDNIILINYGEITLADLILQFPEPMFSIGTYSFLTGKIKFDMKEKNIIRIEECIMKGRQIDIQSSGKIHVDRNFSKSILDIKAKIVLYPLFFMNAGDASPIDVAKNSSDNTIVHLNIGGAIEKPIIVMDQGTK